MNKIIYTISFFIFSGFYAVLAIVISLGMLEVTRIVTLPIRLLTTFLMAYVVFKMFGKHKVVSEKKFIYILFILFWGLYTLKVLLHYSSGEYLFRNWFVYIFYALNFAIFPFFTFSLIDFNKYQKIILNALIFSGFVMGVISLYLYKDILTMGLGRISMVKYENPEQETLSPLALSYAGALTIALCLYKIVFYARKLTFSNKVYLYATIVLAFIMFFLGASRGSVVALVMCLPLFLIYSKGKTKLKFMVLIILSIPLIIWGATKVGSSVFERTTSTLEGGSTGREELWSDALHEFTNNVIIGGRIEIGFYPHNFVLETLMATGIIGTLLLMFIIIKAFKNIYKYAFISDNYIWVFIVLIQGFVQCFFTGAVYFSVLLFFPLGLIYSITKKNIYE